MTVSNNHDEADDRYGNGNRLRPDDDEGAGKSSNTSSPKGSAALSTADHSELVEEKRRKMEALELMRERIRRNTEMLEDYQQILKNMQELERHKQQPNNNGNKNGITSPRRTRGGGSRDRQEPPQRTISGPVRLRGEQRSVSGSEVHDRRESENANVQRSASTSDPVLRGERRVKAAQSNPWQAQRGASNSKSNSNINSNNKRIVRKIPRNESFKDYMARYEHQKANGSAPDLRSLGKTKSKKEPMKRSASASHLGLSRRSGGGGATKQLVQRSVSASNSPRKLRSLPEKRPQQPQSLKSASRAAVASPLAVSESESPPAISESERSPAISESERPPAITESEPTMSDSESESKSNNNDPERSAISRSANDASSHLSKESESSDSSSQIRRNERYKRKSVLRSYSAESTDNSTSLESRPRNKNKNDDDNNNNENNKNNHSQLLSSQANEDSSSSSNRDDTDRQIRKKAGKKHMQRKPSKIVKSDQLTLSDHFSSGGNFDLTVSDHFTSSGSFDDGSFDDGSLTGSSESQSEGTNSVQLSDKEKSKQSTVSTTSGTYISSDQTSKVTASCDAKLPHKDGEQSKAVEGSDMKRNQQSEAANIKKSEDCDQSSSSSSASSTPSFFVDHEDGEHPSPADNETNTNDNNANSPKQSRAVPSRTKVKHSNCGMVLCCTRGKKNHHLEQDLEQGTCTVMNTERLDDNTLNKNQTTRSADDETISNRNVRRKRCLLVLLIVCFFIIAIVAVAVNYVLKKIDKMKEEISKEFTDSSGKRVVILGPVPEMEIFRDTEAPTASPTILPKSEEYVYDYILSKSYDNGTALSAFDSPQIKAYTWMWDMNNAYNMYQTISDEMILQKFALGVLYYSTGGDSSWLQSHWLKGPNECHWFSIGGPTTVRIVCDESGSITSLELVANNLNGTIPEEIGYLTTLKTLRIENYPAVGRKKFQKYDNGIIDTKTNKEKGFGRTKNSQTKYDENIVFQAKGNNIIGSSINKNFNKFQLNYDGSDSLLFNTKVQMVKDGFITGTIPTQLGLLSDLTTLIITNSIDAENDHENSTETSNGVSGTLPTDLAKLTHLNSLIVLNNNLQGTIPTEIQNLNQSLKVLDLANNNGISGTIPTELQYLMPRLQFLDLGQNSLSGAIPRALFYALSPTGSNSVMRSLSLHDNQLTGRIPSEIGLLASGFNNFEILNLYGNHFVGDIPPEIGYCLSLKEVHLNSNQLTGTIPTSFGGFLFANSITLHNNSRLSGTIPQALCEVKGNKSTNMDIYIDCSHVVCECGCLCSEIFNTEESVSSYLPGP